MQRWLFFIILTPCFLFGQSNSIDIQHTEISYWLEGPRAATGRNLVNARAVVTFRVLENATAVNLLAGGFIVSSIRRRQGREKEMLSFNQENGVLEVQAALHPGEQHEWVMDYQLDLSREELLNYVQQEDEFLAFNPFNVNAPVSAGAAGTFYPTLAGDESYVRLNITIREKRNTGFPGILEFETTNGDGSRSQFWKTEKPITPESFYLVIGEFKEFDAEDLEEEFEMNQVALKALRWEKARATMTGAVEFFGLELATFSDSQYHYLDSLSGLPLEGFFIVGTEAGLDAKPEEWARRKVMALHLESNDTAKASERLWRQTVSHKGIDWRNAFLNNKWKTFDQLGLKQKKRLLSYRVEQWKDANAELLLIMDPAELDTTFIQPLLQSTLLPEINISYRYVARDTALYVSYKQDTAAAPAYHIPLRVNVYSGDEVKTETLVMRKVEGQFKVTFPKVPSAAGVGFGTYFPGRVEEQKPDSYLLFQLSRASTVEQRRQALEGLFKTSNPNLFSTALGIAMRDEDAEIRLLAVQNAGELNIPAQQKLKDTLLKLTEDPSAEVRQKAEVLVKKYYE